jgi:NADH-quinone oxidoreductase subunit J
VMYMMDPGGLGKMDMSHQKRPSKVAGVVAALAALAVVAFTDWDPIVARAPSPKAQARALGMELMERSMLIFETAGVAILVAMIAATTVALARRR